MPGNKFFLETTLFNEKVFCLFSGDSVSLCSTGCLRTHCVEQGDLELRDSLVSASQVFGLKAWATTPYEMLSLEKVLQGGPVPKIP